MTTAANKEVVPSLTLLSTPAGVPSIVIRVPVLEVGESITVPVPKPLLPKEGAPAAIVLSMVSCVTRDSPPETIVVSPEGPGSQPARPPPNAPAVSSERVDVLPQEQPPSNRQPDFSPCRDDFFSDDVFPGKSPNFKHNERIKSETGVQRMEAARRIACVLAMHRIPG